MEQILEQYGGSLLVFVTGGMVLNLFLEVLERVTNF